MPRIPLLEVGELDDATRESLRPNEAAYGFIPNASLLLARVPGLLMGARALAKAVLVPGRVGMELKWFVAHVSSMSAECRFCSAHTATFAHNLGGTDVDKVAALFEFETSDHFNDTERAALRLAVAGGRVPNEVTDEHIADLRQYFDDDQILELVAVISFYGFFNRWNDILATPLEDIPLRFAEKTLAAAGWDPGANV